MRTLNALVHVLGHRLHELVRLILDCQDEKEMKRLHRRHREVEKLLRVFDPGQKTN
jgi:hypothetical protein